MTRKAIVLALSLLRATGLLPAETTREFLCLDLVGTPWCGASSRLDGGDDWGTYHEVNLFDHDSCTAWVEGADGDGIGQEVWFEVEPGLHELHITNGYARDASVFARNNRVRKLELTLWAGIQAPGMVTEIGPLYRADRIGSAWSVELADSPRPQAVALDLDWDAAEAAMADAVDAADALERCAYILSLRIRDVYRGTHYRDTCISEIGWTLGPEHAGPGGLGRMELMGTWWADGGAPWRRLELEWFPFYRGWTAYVGDKPQDAGTWEMGRGRLVLRSDGGDAEHVYDGATLHGGRLVLVTEDGGTQVWKR